MIVVGVDGCKGGWVAAEWDIDHQTICFEVHRNFQNVLDAYPPDTVDAIAIDIPIGLIECGRTCDREARAVLRCRKPSVFPAPDPRIACMTDHHAANDLMRHHCGKGIPAQAFGIYAKVCEVNELMTPDQQDRIIEIHPEICFWAMNGGNEICAPKRTDPGYLERWEVLRGNIALTEESWKLVRAGARGAQSDDILDSIAAAWTAERWANPNKSVGRFPAIEQKDDKGLRADIVY